MIATRPDWCISRQRVWGVPIAVFICEGCQQPYQDAALNRRIIELFQKEGAEAWHTVAADSLLPSEANCARRRLAVLPPRDRHPRRLVRLRRQLARVHGSRARSPPPAELYFEGGDQYRGWFHTSLLTSVGVGEQHETPFRMVGTPVGRSTSRAALCRNLWATASIPSTSLNASARKSSASGSPRRLPRRRRHQRSQSCSASRRTTASCGIRFGFCWGISPASTPRADAVADGELLPLDRYMLARCREFVEKVVGVDGQRPAGTETFSSTASITRSTNSACRTQRVLPRRAQGPPLHLCAKERRTPQRADGPLANHRSARAPGRSDS